MGKIKYYSIFGIILLAVLAVSFSTLTTKPRLWIDEAKSIELAGNFLNFGKLNIQTAPGEFTDFPEILQSTGYPVTAPLAIFFKLFGYGLVQARIYMLIWMVAALLAVFLVGRKLIGDWPALGSVLLIATFASFYDSGRTVVGEIPGFVFLLSGLYFWLTEKYSWSGFWLGLAVVAKPSVYAWIIPAIFLVLLLEKTDFLKRISAVAVGMLPAAIGWIFFVLEHPFSKSAWVSIGKFFKNPYDAVGWTEQFFQNLFNIPYSTTLIYFGIYFLILILAKRRISGGTLKLLYNFVLIYGIFAFVYYLRSPGWLRYILAAELLILFLLPKAISLIVKNQRLVFALIAALSLIQIVQFFTAADIFYSDSAIQAADYLNGQFSDKTIGVLDSLNLAILLETNRRFLAAEMAGFPLIGENSLFNDPLPEIIASDPDNKFFKEGAEIIQGNYQFIKEIGGYNIYSLKLIRN